MVADALASAEAIARATALRLALITMASWGDYRGVKSVLTCVLTIRLFDNNGSDASTELVANEL